MALHRARIIHDTTKWKVSGLISLHAALMWDPMRRVGWQTCNMLNK